MSPVFAWAARIGVCVAVALPALATPSNAEAVFEVSTDQRPLLAGPGPAFRAVTLSVPPLGEVGLRAAPAVPVAPQPARSGAVQADSASLRCLTEALYFEARGEPVAGQRAVAEVILNRVAHPAFPKSVCGVVNQGGQFSYKGRRISYNDRGALARAQRLAQDALSGAPRTLTNGATYFHTTGVRPSWAGRLVRTTRIGSHIFYRSGGAQRMAAN